ncbi:MAG: hypothetical protein IKZ31_02735 [Lentisphaeria bacterium]|nr:hypothetical protein [Lentisphaeria bacterium]
MKKFAVMLFAGVAALVLGAAEMDVNGAFAAKPGAALPTGWIINNGPKPVGTHELVQKDGRNAVKINAEKSMYGLAYNKRFLVKPGEKYQLSVDADGKNVVVNVGMFLYHGELPKYVYLKGNYDKAVKIQAAQTVSRVITIPEEINGKVPTLMGVTCYVLAPGEVTFSNFKLEKLD